MKGIILAGGFGTRLRPLTDIVNKHLLPIYDRPMISYALETLKRSGMSDILIVTEESHIGQFSGYLKRGDTYGVRLSYAAQRGAGGIAAALALAREFADGDSVAVVLGDNVFEDSFRAEARNFSGGARIFLKKVSDPERFGVPAFEGARVAIVHEKPEKPQSEYAVVGFYLFDNAVFDVISALVPSHRGELEITDAVNHYARKGALGHVFLRGYWADAGTFNSLLDASSWAKTRAQSNLY